MSYQQFRTSTRSPEELALIFLINYERPANTNQPDRQMQARYWYNYLRDWDPEVPEGAGGEVKPLIQKLKMKIVNGIVLSVERVFV